MTAGRLRPRVFRESSARADTRASYPRCESNGYPMSDEQYANFVTRLALNGTGISMPDSDETKRLKLTEENFPELEEMFKNKLESVAAALR